MRDLRAWLFSIMHNLHVDAIRRPKLATVTMDDDTPEVAMAPTQGERLAVLDLQAALDLLPTEQKEIVLLVALEDMTYADVAATLGIPIWHRDVAPVAGPRAAACTDGRPRRTGAPESRQMSSPA